MDLDSAAANALPFHVSIVKPVPHDVGEDPEDKPKHQVFHSSAFSGSLQLQGFSRASSTLTIV